MGENEQKTQNIIFVVTRFAVILEIYIIYRYNYIFRDEVPATYTEHRTITLKQEFCHGT